MNAFDPNNYKISLIPDLNKFKFSGTVEITGETRTGLDEITLNTLELAVWRCAVRLDENTIACSFFCDPEKEELRIQLPQTMSGPILITIEYEGLINDRMAGFYRSSYQVEGKTHHIAVTQFQESDARRAFPCLDHPQKKATFDIEIVIDSTLAAISNTVITEEEPLERGKKRVKFQQTPIMSTYLLFFGVGDFKFVINETDKRVRAATIPGMLSYADYGLEFGQQALTFCEDYYRIPYPLPKMDLIAIPDFAFGAMENWGAITFRENLLLHYPDITSRSGEERICEVIAHEIAHQWFGNLVTPSDWKYLWLNESFATFFGYGVVDHYHPRWGIWQQFLGGQTAAALVRDGLHETFAIEIPGGEHVVINTSTAPIIYSKGGSILRQIQGFIGKDNFRDGLTQYLKKHSYSNAASHHLWEAFEEVAEKPITKMMKSWIEQPGFPIVSATRRGNTLVLRQQRFTYLPNTYGQLWDIPVNIRLFNTGGDTRMIQTVMDSESTEIELDSDTAAYKINAGQTGFYRVRYEDRKDFDALGRLILDGTLPPEDRWGLQNDLFNLVRSGVAAIDDYLSFLSYYVNEDAYLPISSIAGNLFQSYLVFEGETKANIAAAGKSLLEKSLSRMGYEPLSDEPFTITLLRDQVIFPVVLYGSEDASQFFGEKFKALISGESVHADILKSVMQVGALNGNNGTYTWLKERFESSASEHERMNILAAFGCFSDRELIEKSLQYSLDEVPDRNKFIPIVAMSSNPYAVDSMWDWYVAHLSELEQFHPMLYERVIAGIVPVGGIGKTNRVRAFFEKYIQQHPQTTEVVKLSLEKLEINLRMKERLRR